jgi:hypothetical protein
VGWDGSAWQTEVPAGQYHLVALWGDALDDLFAVGTPDASPTTTGIILRRQGGQWSVTRQGAVPVRAVWGSSGTNVYAIDKNGNVAHFDGSAWTDAGAIPGDPAIRGVSALFGRSASDIYLLEEVGVECMRFDGAGWTSFPINGFALWGDANGLVAAGVGEVERYAGPFPSLPGGACAAPIPLYCNAPLPFFGDTTGRAAQVASWACGSRPTSGPEVYYRFDAPITGTITAHLTPHAGDLDLFLVGGDPKKGCAPSDCLAASQHDGSADESITAEVNQGSTYFLAIDGYQAAAAGYTLTLDCTKE